MESHTVLVRALPAGLLVAIAGSAAHAQPFVVNISGATLQEAFFEAPASSHDFIDVDGDGNITPFRPFPGAPLIPDPLADSPPLDQPALDANGWWVVQYRAVGSVNGFRELLAFGDASNGATLADPGLSIGAFGANGPYDVLGVPSLTVSPSNALVVGDSALEQIDTAKAGLVLANGFPTFTPSPGGPVPNVLYEADNPGGWPVRGDLTSFAATLNPAQANAGIVIDVAPLDVTAPWVVQTPGAAVAPRLIPGDPGYGTNPLFSTDASGMPFAQLDTSGSSNTLPDISIYGRNFDTGAPNADTVFSTLITWTPVAFPVNFGVGRDRASAAELRHGFVSGRLPTGENLTFVTRDVGSGTRNAAMNGLGLDPSTGVGENIGPVNNATTFDVLGSSYNPSNKLFTDRVIRTVRNTRIAIGYAGAESVESELNGEFIEVLAVRNDGGTEYSRPSIDEILNNDIDGYRIGGPGSWATIGDPRNESEKGGEPGNTNPRMSNEHAAAYINNITRSVEQFQENPTGQSSLFTPGQFLATRYVPFPAQQFNQSLDNPLTFEAIDTDETLASVVTASNILRLPIYATFNADGTGEHPFREVGTGITYSDGVANGGSYLTVGGASVSYGTGVEQRNAVAGDFAYDLSRDAGDIPEMIAAWRHRNGGPSWDGDASGVNAFNAANPGVTAAVAGDAIPEVLGDFDGDGNFDADDVRYFADGFALVDNGIDVDGDAAPDLTLDRAAGFTAVDQAFGGAFFVTVIAGGNAYEAGDARADIAGPGVNARTRAIGINALNADGSAAGTVSVAQNVGVTPGFAPVGHDGVVDLNDVDYIVDNFGAFLDLDAAARIDLSADMNGDLVVDVLDVCFVVGDVLGVPLGDLDLDGVADPMLIADNIGLENPRYSDGDVTGDGVIDMSDVAVAAAGASPCVVGLCPGDRNGDLVYDAADVQLFVAELDASDPAADLAAPAGVDANDLFEYLNRGDAFCLTD